VLEGAACGCPLIVSDIPAHSEFLDDEKAVFLKSESPNHIAEAILQVLSNPNHSKKIASCAQQSMKQLTISEIGSQYDKVYQQVLRRKNTSKNVKYIPPRIVQDS
jgi:glycosyltransferase involved in cell wall biosynthesis